MRRATGCEGDRVRPGERLRRPGRAQHDAILSDTSEPADAVLTDPALAGGALMLGHPLGTRPPGHRLRGTAADDRQPGHGPIRHGPHPASWAPRPTTQRPSAQGRSPHRVPHSGADCPGHGTGSFTASHCRSRCWTGPVTRTRSCSSPCPSSSTPAPMRPRVCISPARSRPPAPGRRSLHGGVIWTARALSSTSPRGPSPTATTRRSSLLHSRGSPSTTYSWSSRPAAARSTPSHRCPQRARRQVPAVRRAAPEDRRVRHQRWLRRCAVRPSVWRAHRHQQWSGGQARGGRPHRRSGVGRRLNSEAPTADNVRKAVRAVLHDPRYRAAAQRISASMARAEGMAGLARTVDDLAAPRSS